MGRGRREISFWLLAWGAVLLAGCGEPSPEESEASQAAAAAPFPTPRKLDDLAGIHNLLRVSEKIYSGSEPHGEEAFESLKRMGVKTIVSVDGARPDVERAKKHGLRYVHIPIGYDGVPKEAGESLTRLVWEGEAPFYFHCHHGEHRGPAAAAIACVASGAVDGKGALAILELAGTCRDYPDLWRDVENYQPPEPGAKLPELVETAEVSSFAAAMAQADRAYDNLKLSRDAGWSVPPDHPDVSPAQEALLLVEGLHESGRNLGEEYDVEPLKTWLAESEQLAKDLRTAILQRGAEQASTQFARLEQSCQRCHQKYRNRRRTYPFSPGRL